ncbi:undecaprenyl-diphosphate phosphatase, partial [Candidatus Woesearchaeota archaeon]|nr:undecaprenyl-diphosphate phosphatase [Candidatus Woesearchaeota archaeon]
MNIVQALILGIVQGITEWLPVSSSGHLVLVQEYFGLSVPVAFDVMLHAATLLVVFVIFWKDIIAILKSLLKLKWDENTKLLVFIIIASIPIALIGYLFHDFFVSLFSNVIAVGIALLCTGTFLYFTKIPKHNKQLNWWKAVIVGIAQAIAIIPGISRSGSTISAGLYMNIDRKKIARFSFLLSIPAIIGASIFEFKNLVFVDTSSIVVGSIASFIVGYISLKWLLKIIHRGKFHNFSYYCWS